MDAFDSLCLSGGHQALDWFNVNIPCTLDDLNANGPVGGEGVDGLKLICFPASWSGPRGVLTALVSTLTRSPITKTSRNGSITISALASGSWTSRWLCCRPRVISNASGDAGPMCD